MTKVEHQRRQQEVKEEYLRIRNPAEEAYSKGMADLNRLREQMRAQEKMLAQTYRAVVEPAYAEYQRKLQSIPKPKRGALE